jgi:hypothetical protein
MADFLVKVYAALLHLYPTAFRDEFGAEMEAVFAEAQASAAAQGWLKSFLLFAHELTDLPASLLRQHWAGDDLLPGDPPAADPCWQVPGSWRAALLASLPHLLFALSIYLPLATSILLDLPASPRPAQFPFWTLTAIVLLLAWSRAWPRWSSSWIGYGLVFLVDRLTWALSPGPLVYLLLAVWVFLAFCILLWLARRDWLSSLLAVLPVAPMWVWWLSSTGSPALLSRAMHYASIGLMLFLAVIAIVRAGRWQTAVLLLLAVLLAVGIPLPAADGYYPNLTSSLNANPGAPSPVTTTNYWLLLFLTSPLWLLALWRQALQEHANR